MIDRRRLLCSSAAGLGLAVLGRAGAKAQEAASPLRAWMDRTFEQRLDLSPTTVTSLGLDTGPRAAAKSQLSLLTPEQEERWRSHYRTGRAELSAMDRAAMSERDRLYYDSLIADYDSVIATYDIRYGQGGWPQVYSVSHQGGAWSETPSFLMNQHTIETAADADAYVARVNLFAEQLAAETVRLREEYTMGVIPPDFILAKAIAQQEGMVAVPADKAPLVESIATRAVEAGLPGDWSAEVERLLVQRVYPALAAQTEVLRAAQAHAGHDAAVKRLPRGEEYYRNSLRYITTTNLAPDEIHRIGREQIAELSARADVVLKAQGMTLGSVGERIAAMGKDPRYIYPNTDAGKVEMVARLNRQMAAVQDRLPQAFGRLPKARAEVQRVPPAIEQGAPLGYYNSPSLDGSRPGIYWINLKDTADWPSWTLPTLTYHEASPGHHLQIALQQESPSAPMLMNLLFYSAYVEGWGLYAEQLADELGAYDDDPAGQIGYLRSLMFRSARLVVDTGIHHLGWSREEAIRYMMESYGDTEGSATSEVERYCAWPGQACAYKVGHNEWVRLREKAKTALGPRFDIRGFHDTALAAGGVPLSVLERVVDGWIARQQA